MSQQNSSGGPGQMQFFEHIDELRARLVRALWVFFAGFIGFYFLADHIMEILKKPLFDALPPDQQKLYFTGLFENFMAHLKIAGYSSLVFLSPYYFYELWSFIAPGLYQREKKIVIPFIAAATTFFAAGASFAYFVLFPVGFKYFVSYGTASDVPMMTIENYYSTTLKLLFLFGVAFELPVITVLLGFLGLIDAPMLRAHRKTAIIMITIVSAFVAPPDAMSMIILGVPLVLMFEASIWVIQWIGVRRAASRDAANSEKNVNPLIGQSK